MTPILIWGTAALLYAVFMAWYQNWRAPLSRAEVDAYLEKLQQTPEGTAEALAVMKPFLEADDGREFLMLNLIAMSRNRVKDPATGRETSAAAALQSYLRPFLRALIKRAGHPIFMARAVGNYVDSWGVEPNPGWSAVSLMRYRSRRDLMELVTSAAFSGPHKSKIAAMPATLSFPVAPPRLLVGPRIWVGLVLALAAALLHLIFG